MHHHYPCVQLLRHLLGPDQLAPGLTPPYALGDEQARRVHGQYRDAMVVHQPPEHLDVLADRIGRNHDLDPVVAKARRHLTRPASGPERPMPWTAPQGAW